MLSWKVHTCSNECTYTHVQSLPSLNHVISENMLIWPENFGRKGERAGRTPLLWFACPLLRNDECGTGYIDLECSVLDRVGSFGGLSRTVYQNSTKCWSGTG